MEMATRLHDHPHRECQQGRRPDPPQRPQGGVAWRKGEEASAGEGHDQGRYKRPALRLVGPAHRRRAKQSPARGERQESSARYDVLPRTREDVVETIAACKKYGAPVLSRGGGTSLAGQCCNVAVVMDWSKYLHRVLEVDAQTRTVTLLVPNMRLDLGGIGKGYAADEALRVLKSRGLDRALVAASGDIAVGNPPPNERGWRVGISGINARTNATRTVLLRNAGISTSGDTEQYIEIDGVRYSHIVNPATGLGLTERIQATVIGPDATTTDSLDTTVSVLGVTRGLALIESLPRTAALIVTKENGREQIFTSRRFKRIPQVP